MEKRRVVIHHVLQNQFPVVIRRVLQRMCYMVIRRKTLIGQGIFDVLQVVLQLTRESPMYYML